MRTEKGEISERALLHLSPSTYEQVDPGTVIWSSRGDVDRVKTMWRGEGFGSKLDEISHVSASTRGYAARLGI